MFHRNMFLNRFGKPSKYIPWCMIIWGIISVCTGATFFRNTLISNLDVSLPGFTTKFVSASRILLFSYFDTSFFGALCARFFLGFVEAAFFPGALVNGLYAHIPYIFKTFFSSSSQNGTNGMNYLKGRPFFFVATFSATPSGLSLLQRSLA